MGRGGGWPRIPALAGYERIACPAHNESRRLGDDLACCDTQVYYIGGVVQRAGKLLFVAGLTLCLSAGVPLAVGQPTNTPVPPTESTAKTDAFIPPKSLAELLALAPDQLEKVDIAIIDLLCAEGLRGSEDLNVQKCLDTLNTWVRYVEAETKRNQHLFEEHPERYKNSLAYYRMAMVATVLCEDLRMRYNPEREKQLENGHRIRSDDEQKKFFEDSKDVFIHGLIGGKHYGTCASMPFLYAAVARRLGYPVTLATTATHFYVRYEEGEGKHLNVEATEHRAFLTPSDNEYKNPWELHVSDEEVSGMRYLQPLSNKEILGHSLLTRAEVLRSMNQYEKQAETWATAARYLPDTPMWRGIEHDMQQMAKNEGEQRRRNAMWNKIAQIYIPHGAGYAYFQDRKVRLHLVMNYSTDTAAIERARKQLEDDLRAYVKPFIEPGDRLIGAEIPLSGMSDGQTVLRYSTASGKDVKIPADFLPPFERRIIPPEVCQRVADKKLEDGESILAEFWAFYDETAQARQAASQRASRQRAIQTGNGTSAILVAREQLPLDYWEGIPPELETRLQGINDPQAAVAEINAYYTADYVRKHGHAPPDETAAKQLAAAPGYDGLPANMRNALVRDPAFGYQKLNPPGDDEGRRGWAQEQSQATMREYLQRVNASQSRIRIVPSSTVNGGSAEPSVPQVAPLTAPAEFEVNSQVNGKGKQ